MLDSEVVDVCDTCGNSNPMRQVKAKATAHMEEAELQDSDKQQLPPSGLQRLMTSDVASVSFSIGITSVVQH